MDKRKMESIIALILKDAQDKRSNASYGGRWDDGGAGSLETQVLFFQYGLAQTVPPEWNAYEEQYEKEIDPEYREYLRLQRKFR
jgi:NADH:ubiquinone oxidoreductase subunit